MQQWSLIQNQPLLKTISKPPPIISYKRGKSLKDILVRAKTLKAHASLRRKPHREVCVGMSMTFSSLKSEVRSPKSEVRSPKSEVRSPKSEVRSPKSEVGSRKSEVGSRKSEVGSRKSEVGSRKSEV